MYKSLSRVIACALLVSPLLASDTGSEGGQPQRKLAPVSTETSEQRITRRLAELNTPEAIAAGAIEHRRRMERDRDYREYFEARERVMRGLPATQIFH